MISNNLILAAASQSGYGQYQDPPNYIWGVGDTFNGQLDSNITALEPVQIGSLTNWSVLGSADSNSYSIKTDGTLWSWGGNGWGGLGLNISTIGNDRSSPVQVGSLTNWQSLTSYRSQGNHTFAIKTDGTLWAWGEGAAGMLGDGTTVTKSSPIQIGALTDWMQVSSGQSFTMAVKTDGTLWAWGLNNVSQLGLGDTTNRSSPVQIGALTDWLKVACGGSHTVAIKQDNTIWSWGFNSSGQLGLNDKTNRNSPVQIGTLTDWLTVVCGFHFTIALKTDGTLWSWGNNGLGALGNNSFASFSSPIQIGSLTTWANVFCGNSTVHAIKTDGTLWGWGGNTQGTIGDGTTISKSSPVQIGTYTDWESISSGNQHTIGKRTDGTLWSWGGNSDVAALGTAQISALGRTVMYSSPIQITHISNISKISLDAKTVHAIKKDGTLWTWGYGENGELGNSSLIGKASPVQIGTSTDWSKISSGEKHTAAVKTNGTLWMWGRNDSGELGNQNPFVSESSPIQIGTDTNWYMVSAGASYTFAIKTDGTLWAWGANNRGQLGTGNTSYYSSPVQVGALTNWSNVFAGYDHTMAIKTDGTLWAWGYNVRGQLGIGSFVNRSSPVQVGLLTNWSDIAVGGTDGYTIAIKTDGTLWSWGNHANGINGLSVSYNNNSPVQVGLLTNWKNIYTSKNGRSAIALKTDGTLWAWGLNSRGQLGLGDRTNRSSPVQIGTLTSWVSGSCGQFSSLFLTS